MIRAPRFWARPPRAPGLAAHLLAPLSWLWAWATRRSLARGARSRLDVPVICVGNLTAGGAGKTPTVIALIDMLRARGLEPCVISRGHGGRLEGPVAVDPRRHGPGDVGDEALLLAAFAPVQVGHDRAAAGRAAVASGAQVIVMDDGFQNPALAMDLGVVVVDAEFGFGNGRVIPAGPLREPVTQGLGRADLVLAIGTAEQRDRLVATWPVLDALPRAGGALRPLATGMDWQGLRSLAFAGIGRPDKFFASLAAAGAAVVATHAFADHAPYHRRLLARLEAEAGRLGAQLVTTEKDAARLPGYFRPKVLAFPVRLELSERDALDAELDRVLPPR